MTQPDFPNKKDILPVDKAVKIECRYCDIKDICNRRERKESLEQEGVTTYCTITPNRKGSKRKSRRRRAKSTRR